DEYCSTSPKDSQPYFVQSWMVVRAMVMLPFSAQMRSSGRTTPSSRAAAARITLNVEPGSNGSLTARLRQWSRDGTSRNVFGLNVGRIASASTSPVRGSSTTAIAALAWVRRQAASSSRSARYWIVRSSVSITPCPGAGGCSTASVTTSRPSASRPTTALPGVPASAAPWRSTIGPRCACSTTVREYCRSASAARSAWRTICSQPRRPRTPVNARASRPARTRTRMRRPLMRPSVRAPPGRRRASPDGRSHRVARQCGEAALVGGGQPGAARRVLARQTDLRAVGRDQPQLTRALLDTAGRLQRRHLDLELAKDDAHLGALAVEALELVGEVHLLDAQP